MLKSPKEFPDAYRNTVLNKDVEAHLALYDEAILAFDMWGAWKLEGLELWRKMIVEWFGSLDSERVRCDFSEVQVRENADLAHLSAIIRYTAIDANHQALRSLCNRISVAMELRDGVWRVFHQHTSAPIDDSSMKAKLEYPA